RKVSTSTITVPLISMTPAVPVLARKVIRLLGGDVRQEHETKGQVDEVHRFDEADDREQPGDHATLSLGLARDPADEGVAGQAVGRMVPRMVPPTTPTRGRAKVPKPAIRPIMTAPAKMFPNSRSDSVTGFTSSSRMFSGV